MKNKKKKTLVVANWKMNPASLAEAKSIFNGSRSSAKKLKNIDLVITPPFVYLDALSKLNRSKNMELGVQNISEKDKGAFTGEISIEMIKAMGAKYAIVGHSERRAMGETNELIRKKLESCFNRKITPILCIGEESRDKEGLYLDFIKNQIIECLTGIQKRDLIGMIIAYEPVWAIGKSYRESMSPTDVHETTLVIKKIAGEVFGRDSANSFKILYGGSVESQNVREIMDNGNVDGFLVGHASLETKSFSDILSALD